MQDAQEGSCEDPSRSHHWPNSWQPPPDRPALGSSLAATIRSFWKSFPHMYKITGHWWWSFGRITSKENSCMQAGCWLPGRRGQKLPPRKSSRSLSSTCVAVIISPPSTFAIFYLFGMPLVISLVVSKVLYMEIPAREVAIENIHTVRMIPVPNSPPCFSQSCSLQASVVRST